MRERERKDGRTEGRKGRRDRRSEGGEGETRNGGFKGETGNKIAIYP